MDESNVCPACGGKRWTSTEVVGVRRCVKCSAIVGECYKGQSFALVLPWMTTDKAAEKRQRYFDLTTLGSDGLGRRHGWYDPETRLITQVG